MSLQNNEKQDWLHMVDNIGNFLAPSMAKDHPNLPVVKAEGCYYYGADGKRYLDFTSGIAVENVGHRHPLAPGIGPDPLAEGELRLSRAAPTEYH